MAQTGQAAKAVKKKADALPKVSTGKLVKDLAINAAMFTPPGRVLRAVGIVSKAAKAAEAAKALEAAKELRLTKGLVGKKGQATLTRAEKAKITPTPAEAKQKSAFKKDAIHQAEEAKKVIPTPPRTVKRDVVQKPARKPLERIPSTKAVALEPKPNVGGGLKTTTGQGRKPLPSKDVTDITKERTKRPNNSGRVRDVKKPSLKELSPSEKAADIASKKSPVTVTKKEPMSPAEIAKARATARKAKFDKVLTPRPKPKPNRKPLKPIDRSRGSNAPVKPRLNDKQQILENAKDNPRNWDVADQRRPSNIAEGRGNTLQPPSVTKNPIERGSAAQKKEARMEKRKARQANRRDRRTDIRESSTPGFEKLQPVRRGKPKTAEQRAEGRANAEERTKFAANSKKGSKMSKRSTTNDPRNAASDAGNMKNRLKEIDAKAAANKKARAIGKGGNRVSPELKVKVESTLNSGKTARKSRQLQNTFNKPKFSRNVTTGRLRATRPIKPVKK